MTSLTAVIAMFAVFLMVVFLQMSEAVPIRPDSDATSIVESQGPWNFLTGTDVRQSLHQIRQQIAEECEFLWIYPHQLSSSLSASHANQLADTLGVSPLYKQQASARWNAAAQVYRSSRAHSPTQEVAFSFPDTNFINSSPNGPPISKTPLSLEDIANMNRKRHEEGISITPVDQASAPLELEAIAAVHELATQVESISVSEMLPHTPDLIFVNLKTQEEQPYTLELTMKGWRIASSQTDSMNGDYMKIGLHTMYYRNAAELLHVISPNHISRFNECVAERLTQLAQIREGIST